MKIFHTICLFFLLLLSLSLNAQQYDYTLRINDSLTIVGKNQKYGIKKGDSIIIPLKYDFVTYYPKCAPLVFSASLGMDGKEKFGFINIKKPKDTNPIYDQFEPVYTLFDFIYYKVQKDKKWGLLDSEGVEVITTESDEISYDMSINLGTIRYSNDIKYFTFSFSGEIDVTDEQPLGTVVPEVSSSSDQLRLDAGKISEMPDDDAIFTGTEGSINSFIGANFKYPIAASDGGIKGKVNVRFIVELDGSVTNIEIIGQKLGGGIEEETIRVITNTNGLWIPAKLNGKPVRSYYRVPISLRLPTS